MMRLLQVFYHLLGSHGMKRRSLNEEKIIELVDSRISETCSQLEILRYTHVGLLCVQELANDRPNISSILSMLSSDTAELPSPKQPAFTLGQSSSGIYSQQNKQHFL